MQHRITNNNLRQPTDLDSQTKKEQMCCKLIITVLHYHLEIPEVCLATIGLDAALSRDHLSLRLINFPKRWTNLCNHQLGDHKQSFEKELVNFNEV